MLVVKKFGGSSVADPECINRVAERVRQSRAEGQQVVVVVSAMGDTTDNLLALAAEINFQASCRELDMLVTTGEQVSSSLLAMSLEAKGCPAISLTGGQAGIRTNGIYGRSKVDDIDTRRLKEELNANRVVVVAGFQGASEAGEITTLGRGGSDTTAVALAAALRADICEIYTDVDGVYTADPRLVPEASKLDITSHDEMLELASLGAVVLHPRAVELAKLYGVRLVVRSSFHNRPGTMIEEGMDVERAAVVSGVAHDLSVAKIGLFNVEDQPGIASRIFQALAAEHINVDVIVQGATRDGYNDIAFTVCTDDLPRAIEVIKQIKGAVGAEGFTYDDSLAKVSAVGAGMVSHSGVAAAIFEALAEVGINIDMISTSEIKVSCVIRREDVEQAVKALHKKFDLDKVRG